LKLDTKGKLTLWQTGLFQFLHRVYISQLIRYARARSTYDQFLIRGSVLTKKLMSQGFLQSRLQAAVRKYYSRYNDLVCQYNLN
jgi:hypothetical protein